MTSDIEFKDIVLFGVLTVLIIIVFYYFYRKNASTQTKLTQLHNLLNYQQTLIGQSNQSNNAINHEIKMLKNLFKTKDNLENIELPNVTAKEYNLDRELKDELKELDNNITEEEELADETELQEQKEFEKNVRVENKKEFETNKEENTSVKDDTEPKNDEEDKKEQVIEEDIIEEVIKETKKEEVIKETKKEEVIKETKKEEVIEDKIIEVDNKQPTDISTID